MHRNFSPARFRRSLLRGAFLLPVVLAAALSACASSKSDLDPITTASMPLNASDVQKAADYWAKRYAAKPKDKAVALNYAAALRKLGQDAQAVGVLQQAALDFPTDRQVYAAYGKALAATGQLQQALV